MEMRKLHFLNYEFSQFIQPFSRILQLDLVVRDDNGNLLNPDHHSTIYIFRAHEAATERIKQLMNGESRKDEMKIVTLPSSLSSSFHHNHNLYLIVKNFVCRIGEDADLVIALYDGKEVKPISENYLIKWGKDGLMKDLDQLNNLKVVFSVSLINFNLNQN